MSPLIQLRRTEYLGFQVFPFLLVVMALSRVVCAVSDTEKIIDLQRLSADMQEATAPLARHLGTNGASLKAKFEVVNKILSEEQVDKRKLAAGLGDLQASLEAFTADWHSVLIPLWQGQDTVGGAIDRLRLLLARSQSAEPSEDLKEKVTGYDDRLKRLARQIREESDEKRRKRLELVFSSLYALRTLTEKLGGLDLSPAQMAIYTRIIEALSSYETLISSLTFQAEKARVVLSHTAEFVGVYREVLEGVLSAEELVGWLRDSDKGGAGVGVLAAGLEGLGQSVAGFQASIEEFFLRDLTKHVESDAEKMLDRLQVEYSPSGGSHDIQSVIDRYNSMDAQK